MGERTRQRPDFLRRLQTGPEKPLPGRAERLLPVVFVDSEALRVVLQ